jgi:spore germination protein Q
MVNNPYKTGSYGYPGYPYMPTAAPSAPVQPVAPIMSAAQAAPTGQFTQGFMPQSMTQSMPQSMTPSVPVGSAPAPQGVQVPGLLPIEESFIENILRLNLGKIATIYMTFENNSQWNAKVFKGRLEAAGRDHIIISDPQTGMRYLLLMVNLDYVTFDEELNYTYPTR